MMAAVHAHTLPKEELGVALITSAPGGIKYVGWLQGAANYAGGWTLISLKEFTGMRVTLLLRGDHSVHVDPFEPLKVGDLVGHRDDEEPRFGTVEQTGKTAEGRQVFLVRWPGEPEPVWYTRRMLVAIPNATVEAAS